jgi:hypothetical protein
MRIQPFYCLLMSAAYAADIRAFDACQVRADDTAAVQTAINAALASSTDYTDSFSCVAPIRNVIVSPIATFTDIRRPRFHPADRASLGPISNFPVIERR